MKSLLSSTIYLLIFLNVAAYAVAIWFAFSAGKQAGSGTGENTGLMVAVGLAVVMSIILMGRRGSLISPVNELAAFSERLAAGDSKARADVGTNDEFGYIAENLNPAVARVSKGRHTQEAT